ncbi:beta-glucosidase [Bryocella elongata]|uniref:Beta-glucosidase n=1 Tax=Bryocella elongata TaxID=863522 RepID=A0A1H5TTJ4_9BACT|nr:GH1 family beta-glucosidase [Bryocella elongata]SEF65307.1 beta-glucosidase [Bryocella elongata]
MSMNRRELAKLALAAAATPLLEAPAHAARSPASPAAQGGSFPQGFVWGTATAAYQVEGAANLGGRGKSIWDTFSHIPGKVANGDTGDVSADQYHRFKEDIALMRDLGVKGYRFSVSWTRIFPDGLATGNPNAEGLGYYQRLVDALREASIEPYCTLFHWDLPQALEDKGGWQNRDTAQHFADYAAVVGSKLSDRVSHFMTTNEIRSFTELGYANGVHAPGLKLDAQGVAQVKHHGVLAHGLAVQALRAHARPGTMIGLAENPAAATPVIPDAANIHAAEAALREENAPFLTAIFEGRYTERYLAQLGGSAPKFTDAEMKAISSPLDFVGLNIYNPMYIKAADTPAGYTVVHPSPTYPRMASPWLTVGPEALYWVPLLVGRTWQPRAIYITENGASAADLMTPHGEVLDIDRAMFLRNYLNQLQRSITDGAPVKGYFVWSLLDNFEWADGYDKRFGIVYVDYKTQKRTPKLSAHLYRNIVMQNRIV